MGSLKKARIRPLRAGRGRNRADPYPYVAVNCLPLRPGGAGVSTYIRELLTELPPLVDGSIHALVGEDAVRELPDGVVAVPRPPARGVRRALQGMRPVQGARLFHGLDADLPLRSSLPMVTTVQDLAVFDVPWAFARHRVAGERVLVSHGVRRADVVIVPSEFTAERVRAILHRQALVISLAPRTNLAPPDPRDVDRVRLAYGLPDRFVLHVGTIEPRKNVPELAAACRQAAMPLVAAGTAWQKGLAPMGVQCLGYVPDTDLPGLFGAATMTACTSVYEGFGLPPIEAMACGCPVVSTRVPSMELVGDAARLVRSSRPEELALAIAELAQDDSQRADRSTIGAAAVRRLSWATAAQQTAAVYGQLGVAVQDSSAPSSTDGG